jgi:uncharacterized protein (UPF0548 family)
MILKKYWEMRGGCRAWSHQGSGRWVWGLGCLDGWRLGFDER